MRIMRMYNDNCDDEWQSISRAEGTPRQSKP